MVIRSTGKHLWFVWPLLCLSVIAVHISILPFDSRINQDEVQIVDYGRATLNPDEPWAISWNIQKQIPVVMTSYIGPIVQELAFRITAPSDQGIMWSSILGAALSATFALGWLIARQVPPWVSLTLAFAFLIDPALSMTYRDGRVDGWAMAAVLAACWLLRYAETESLKERKRNCLVFFSGIAATLSLFIWPTTAILVPLVVFELFQLLRSRMGSGSLGWLSRSCQLIACFALGGAVATGLFSIPIIMHWEIYLEGLKSTAAIQGWASQIQPPIFDMIAAHDPMIAIVAISALLIKRELGLMLAFTLAVVMAWQTMIYSARLVYFLPYLLAMIGSAAEVLWRKQPAGLGKAVLTRLLAMMVVWNVTVVLVIRPFVAFQQGALNVAEELITELDRVIGEGDFRVLVSDWPPYFAGRALGWQMFRQGSPVDIKTYEEFLPTMDYIIVDEKPRYAALADLVQSVDFELIEKIDFLVYKGRIMDLGIAQLTIPGKGNESLLIYRPLEREELDKR